MSPRVPNVQHVRRFTVVALVALTLLLIGFSNSFGRAQPTGSYRPDLPPAALANGCWSLPAGVTFGFAYQVRSDGDFGEPGRERRRLVMQFDLIDAPAAHRQVGEAFVSAGFEDREPPNPQGLVLTKPGFGRVDVVVTALAGVPDDSIVRGTIVLDLPTSAAETDSPVCSEPFSTKRFPPEWDDRA